jgi:hypothetical protein
MPGDHKGGGAAFLPKLRRETQTVVIGELHIQNEQIRFDRLEERTRASGVLRGMKGVALLEC